MVTGYDVDPAELVVARGRVTATAAQGRADLARLEVQAHDVFAAGWRGGAAAAFRAAYTDWHEGVAEMLAALDTLGQALGDAATEYALAEGANAAGFHRAVS